MKEKENFAYLHIDTPSPTGGDGVTSPTNGNALTSPSDGNRLTSPTGGNGATSGRDSTASAGGSAWRQFWQRPLSFFSGRNTIQDQLRNQLEPEPGKAYRMMPADELLKMLDIENPPAGYLEDEAMAALEVRLRRIGLSLATTITGPLRLRMTDRLPIVDIDTPQASRHSPITICLYLTAWMLQGGKVSQQDLARVDEWIDAYERNSPWSEAAKGTLRWLLSRKLILTYKRKLRTGRIKRFTNVKNRFMDLLLSLVSNPETVTHKRMSRLKTIYETLELDPSTIHSDLHRLSTGSETSVKAKKGESPTWEPDAERLRHLSQATQAAQIILADVFEQTDKEQTDKEQTGKEQTDKSQTDKEQMVQKQEAPELQMLRTLAAREEWRRQEAEQVARNHGTTLGAMLETLNDLAWNVAGESMIDDEEESLYVQPDVAQACLEHFSNHK